MKKRISLFVMLIQLFGGVLMLSSCQNQTQKTVALVLATPGRASAENAPDYTVTYREQDLSDSAVYSRELCGMCLGLCASTDSSDAIQKNLFALDFERIAKYNYEKNYQGDEVGIVIAKKPLKDKTLVLIALRGTKGREWYSDFDVGTSAVHRGFSNAAAFAEKKVDAYLFNYRIDPEETVFLVTGYSRGGAVANLLSATLTDRFSSQRVFSYTFASPNTVRSAHGASYNNIFNLVKEDDCFTKLPLSCWGYRRLGADILLSPISPASPDHAATDDLATRDQAQSVFSSNETSIEKLDRFCRRCEALAPDVDSYYKKSFSIGDEQLSLHDFLMLAARFLSKEDRPADFDRMVQSFDSELSDLSAFFLDGMDIERLMLGAEPEDYPAAKGHLIDGYLASFDQLK